MSTFLIYFETEIKSNTISHSLKYTSVNENPGNRTLQPYLKISKIEVQFYSKVIEGIVIHDGISSGKLINRKEKSTLVSYQRKAFLEYLKNRNEIVSIYCYFCFHLFQNKIERFVIDKNFFVQEISLNDINSKFDNINENILYKIIKPIN